MILAIIQARMSSTRLPGKVMLPILGRPMLAWQIERVRRARRIDRLVIATSREPSDDAIAAFCAENSVDCFRGDLTDVLARFRGAAAVHGPADHIVRLTADCPLSDPAVIDATIENHLRQGADYSGNSVERSYPDGLDVEIMTTAALDAAARDAKASDEREHVTPYLYRHPEKFRIAHLVQEPDLAALRWTVDTADDLRMVEAVFAGLADSKPDFGQADILDFLDRHPEIVAINAPANSSP